jgi:hypothetical protein
MVGDERMPMETSLAATSPALVRMPGTVWTGRMAVRAASAVAALGLASASAACAPAPTPPPAAAPVPFADTASLVDQLAARGLALDPIGSSLYVWFDVPAATYGVGASSTEYLYVHEYPAATAAAAAARRVSPDGTHVINAQNKDVLVQWMGDPHFYQNGRLLVVYVGRDPAVLARLADLVGPQFAGAAAPEASGPEAAPRVAGLTMASTARSSVVWRGYPARLC